MNPFKQNNEFNVARGLLNAKTPKERFKGIVTWFTGHHDLRLLWIQFQRPIHRGALDYVLATYEIKRFLSFLSSKKTQTTEPDLNNLLISSLQGLIMMPYAALTAVRLVLGGLLGTVAGGVVTGIEAIGRKCRTMFARLKPSNKLQEEEAAPKAKANVAIQLEKTADNKVNLDALPKISKGLYWRITKTGKNGEATYHAVSTPIPKEPSAILHGDASKLILSGPVYERADVNGSATLKNALQFWERQGHKASDKPSREGRQEKCHQHRLKAKETLGDEHVYAYFPKPRA